MINLAKYIDSTYLKTPAQSGLTEEETKVKIYHLADEAVTHNLYAVMIRPEYVSEIKKYLIGKNSNVKVGTVIGFHEGLANTSDKLSEAQKAIEDGADDLDFVINYIAFKNGELDLVKNEFLTCSKLCIENGKVVKWIIEIAALSDSQIEKITQNLARWAEENFTTEEQKNIFVKSSTGFYKTSDGRPNGTTVEGIKIMKASAGNLPIKAAGGVRNTEEAKRMIDLGVVRIGTSSALALIGKSEYNQKGY